MVNVIECPDFLEVSFAYRAEMVSAIKEIPGRRFNPDKKVWTVPYESMDQLIKFVDKYNKPGERIEPKKVQNFICEPMPKLTTTVILKRKLYPYQEEGVAYNIKNKRIIIGDEPGLGKTGQAIASVVGADMFPCLVICPATLKRNWLREWKLWTDHQPAELTDGIVKSWPQYSKMGLVDVFICNYESLKKYFVQSIDIPIDPKTNKPAALRLSHITLRPECTIFKSIIIDESHRVKDGKTQQTKFVMKLSQGKEMVLALTGTPVVNRPTDLLAQLVIINQLNAIGGYKSFVNRFGQGNNLKELNWILNNTCFYRRLKKDVLGELPDKTRQIIRCDITNRDEYQKASDAFSKYLRENLNKTEGEINRSLRGEIMVKMMYLRQIAAKGKFLDAVEHIDEVVDAGEKIVVFGHHKEVLSKIINHYPAAVTITGEDNGEQRQAAIDAFQNNPRVQIIVCSIKAAGVGLTLTASSRVLFIEFPWTSADCDQCEDRTHRIGQKNAVQIGYLLGLNTIDEYMYEIIEDKRRVAMDVTGDENLIETNIVDLFVNLFNQQK